VRRLAPLIPILLLSLAGCRGQSGGDQRSGCDLDVLANVSRALDRAPKADQIELVWPGIVDACGSRMPKDLKSYFDYAHDPNSREGARLTPPSDALEAMKQKACPHWDVAARAIADAPANMRGELMHQGCEFDRYGVIADDEIATNTTAIMTWAMHQWFLDQGLATEHANTITRALYALDERGSSPMHGLADLRWPKAHGIPLTSGVPVVLTQTEITFNARMIAQLADGVLADSDIRNHLIPMLFEALDEEALKSKQVAEIRGQAWDEPLLIVADARTPFATIVNVMYTGGRAEFSRYGFVVAPEGEPYAYIPVDPPRYDAGPRMLANSGEPTAVMTVELHADGLSLSRSGGFEGQPEAHPRGADDQILAYAKAVRRDNPDARQVAISADGDVPLEDVLAAIAAARGPGCSPSGEGCVLPEVIVMSGGAHGYDVRPPSEDEVWGGLIGTEIGEAYGVGGLGLVGTGRSNDGSPGTIGLGNTGLIGKGGNHGSGFGGPSRSEAKIRQAKAKVEGDLDSDIIRRIVRAHINEIRSCYNAGLTKNPMLEGRVTIDFVIVSTGKVGESKIADSTLSDEKVGACMAKAVKRWTFPKPRGGGEVKVSYPFALSPN
jgi:biopolymer transport protein ExbD